MRIKFLGVHHEESKNSRLIGFVIDNIMAVDAGTLTSELTFSEQEKIKAILLSHGHYDHIRSVPSFIFSNRKRSTKVYASSQTLKILSSHLFDGIIYPNFTEKTPFLKKPPIQLKPLKPFSTYNIIGYRVLPLPINHIAGSLGFEITSKDGKKIFYTGDSGVGLSALWEHISPELLIIDVTFPNQFVSVAKDANHLCPRTLKKELIEFRRIKGYSPQVVLVHLSPKYEDVIKREIKKISKELKFSISIACEGEILHV
jgi:Cft2 family RNA processing exonuclease